MKIYLARLGAGVLNIILFFGALGMNYFAGSSLSQLAGNFGTHRGLGLAGSIPGVVGTAMWLALTALVLLPVVCAVLWLVPVLPRGLAFVFQVAYAFLALAGFIAMLFIASRTGEILDMVGFPNFGQVGVGQQGGYAYFQLVLLVLALGAGVVALAFRAPGALVVCESGPHAGQRFKLERGDSLVFGRNISACDIIFPPDSVHISRKHCTVTLLPGGRKFLVECHSANGMLVDGAALGRDQAVAVKRGTAIAFENGQWVYRFARVPSLLGDAWDRLLAAFGLGTGKRNRPATA